MGGISINNQTKQLRFPRLLVAIFGVHLEQSTSIIHLGTIKDNESSRTIYFQIFFHTSNDLVKQLSTCACTRAYKRSQENIQIAQLVVFYRLLRRSRVNGQAIYPIIKCKWVFLKFYISVIDLLEPFYKVSLVRKLLKGFVFDQSGHCSSNGLEVRSINVKKLIPAKTPILSFFYDIQILIINVYVSNF